MRSRISVILFLTLPASIGVSAQNDSPKKTQASLGLAPMPDSIGTWSTVAQTTTERWEGALWP